MKIIQKCLFTQNVLTVATLFTLTWALVLSSVADGDRRNKDEKKTPTVRGIQQAFNVGCQKITESGYNLDKIAGKIEIAPSAKGGWVMFVNPGKYNTLMVKISTNGVVELGFLF